VRCLWGRSSTAGGCAMGVGRTLSESILHSIHETITGNSSLDAPKVVMLVVGGHPAALSYAEQTQTAATLSGVRLSQKVLPETSSTDEVLRHISSLNEDESVHGILLQLPVPMHLDSVVLIERIDDRKDIDGLKERNVRRYNRSGSEQPISPCIALACEEVLRSLDAWPSSPLLNLQVVTLGVPSPIEVALQLALGSAGCSVSCCDEEADASVTQAELEGADVLLLGRPRPGTVTANWVRDGCVILDLGLSSCSPPTSKVVGEKQRDVVALCCRDGLAAITAALRMRNASNCALCHQGFLDVHESTGFIDEHAVW